MKNQFKFNRRSKSISFALLLSVILPGASVKGQYVPATNPDITVAGGVNCNAPFVSADMLSNSWGILKAISYDDGSGSNNIFVEDDVAGSVLITLPSGAAEADIVLADDTNNLGTEYIVAATYVNAGRAYITTYQLSGFGISGGLTYSFIGTTLLGATNAFPHMDMFADNVMLVNGLPSLHQYVVTWNDNIGGGVSRINAQYGEIGDPGSPWNAAVIDTATGVLYADVAASHDISGSNLTAYFSIQYNTIPSSSNELRLGKWVCSGGGTPTVTSLMSNETYLPHIEAMGLYDTAASSDPWTIAAPKINSSTDVRLYMFNTSNITGVDCSPIAAYYDLSPMASAVAAGTGDPVGVGNYGNDNYTVGWYANSYGYISKAVDYSTGSISTTFPGEYQINLNMGPGCQKESLAMSSTSNLGKGVLSAWYNGAGRVFYKLSADINSFRPGPTGIADNKTLNNVFTVSPNPSGNIVQVRGSGNAVIDRIELYNLLGQLIYNEAAGQKNVLDIPVASLPNGIYNLTIYSNDSKTVKKIQVMK